MHIPVLLHEAILGLALKKEDIVVDATVGNGGHAVMICRGIGEKGLFIGLDLDQDALDEAEKKLDRYRNTIILKKENFRNLDSVLRSLKITKVDKILFDLGLRTEQLEQSGRGFSLRRDEPLFMSFDSAPQKDALTAADIVNSWTEEKIALILKEYGEERFARKIARAIILSRKKKRILTTHELVQTIKTGIPQRFQKGRMHFATKTFQALRIVVNDEIIALEEGLEKAMRVLAPKGRIAVISFHSLEDRIVKKIFKNKEHRERWERVVKKPITPSQMETVANPKARSAKLRIIARVS